MQVPMTVNKTNILFIVFDVQDKPEEYQTRNTRTKGRLQKTTYRQKDKTNILFMYGAMQISMKS